MYKILLLESNWHLFNKKVYMFNSLLLIYVNKGNLKLSPYLSFLGILIFMNPTNYKSSDEQTR
jgi:hypothetical protein